jgi:putative sugar O-methyltransferase
MLADSRQAAPLWRPTAYWEPYCARIARELARTGLKDVRVNQRLLKGFALGGVPQPTLPRAAWKRGIWRLVAGAPVARLIVTEHRRLIAAEHARAVRGAVLHAAGVIDALAADFPGLAPPAGLDAGGAEDAFDWRGHRVTAHWVEYLCRAADFYGAVKPEAVRAILEIGPGLGLSTLAHLGLNPQLELVVNCDIPPVLYIATQFLRAVPDIHVIDYLDWRGGVRGPRDGAPTVIQIAPWQLPELTQSVDAAFNDFSFQEMEREVCEAYAGIVRARTTGAVFLHAMAEGHRPGAGGQRAPVGMGFLRGLLEGDFPVEVPIPGLWARHYRGEPGEALLLARPAFKF